MLLICSAAFLILAFVVYRYRINKRAKPLKAITDDIYSATDEFNYYLNDPRYFNQRKWVSWKERYSHLVEQIVLPYTHLPIASNYKAKLNNFLDCCHNGPQIIQDRNAKFCDKEMLTNKVFFDSIESHPLTDKQREAIVHDEDNNLIIAGAGTGKTTTIVGKVAYLIEQLKVQPEEILLLAFTRKAADEMKQRIAKRTQITLDVKTFNKFGLDILSGVENNKPTVFNGSDDDEKLQEKIKEEFNKLIQDPHYLRLITQYLVFYLKPYKPQDEFKLKGQYLQYLKSNNVRTFNNEMVKSYEEAEIANYLYMNNIEYQYEEPYKHQTSDKNHKQYEPDFYLPDYKIYIEHFAVTRNGEVPTWFDHTPKVSAKEKYTEGIRWKRAIHDTYKTTLVETYSYEKREGSLLRELENKLKKHGVVFNPKSDDEIVQKKRKDIPAICNLLVTFLTLFKSNGFQVNELITKATSIDPTGRYKAFLEIFDPIFRAYETFLKATGKIDFADMIIRAAQYVDTEQYRCPYKYILIDEFQDMSVGRYKLIKSLIDQNPEQKLFCVGDDWQSVYRFTGSDLSIITNFEKYFGFTRKTVLDCTFRFNDKIASLTSRFIEKNPKQLKKTFKTITFAKTSSCKILYGNESDNPEYNQLTTCLHYIKKENRAAQTKVFILGRYRFNGPSPKELQTMSKAFKSLQIEFHTAHSCKGLEADYVIIDGMSSGKYGFPTEIVDDPMLRLVLTDHEDYPNAEERRLFYVAMTRARHKIYLLTERLTPSSFVLELQSPKDKKHKCSQCGSALIQRQNNVTGKGFLGCSNYPYCKYTK